MCLEGLWFAYRLKMGFTLRIVPSLVRLVIIAFHQLMSAQKYSSSLNFNDRKYLKDRPRVNENEASSCHHMVLLLELACNVWIVSPEVAIFPIPQ